MRVKTQLKFLGTELKQGVKDPSKYYRTVVFLDGTQSVNILTGNVDLFNRLEGFTQLAVCDCELELSLGKYTNCKLLSCNLVQEKK